MKINASIDILVDGEGARINVYDRDARCCFLKIAMSPEQLSAALGRLSRGPVLSAEIQHLDRLGKTMEVNQIVFPMPADHTENRVSSAIKALADYVPDGWVADLAFNSQGSFFSREGMLWARTVIRRWVDSSESEDV